MATDSELELDWGGRAPRHPGQEPAPESPQPAAPPPQAPLAKPHGRPGDPSAFPPGLRFQTERLFAGDWLSIHQQTELSEALIGWTAANSYDVKGDDQRSLFQALEQRGGLLTGLSRNFSPFYRNQTDCVTADGTVFMRVTFPFTWFFRRAEVLAWDQRPLGTVEQRFHLFKLRADVLSPQGQVLLEIHGPMFKFLSFTDWVFEVRHGEVVVAEIRKHWSGWFRETFTNADDFSVHFKPGFNDPRLRQLLVAAALTIDLVSFERKDRHAGGGDLLQNLFSFFD
jgi:uncharacterized protein YxjI